MQWKLNVFHNLTCFQNPSDGFGMGLGHHLSPIRVLYSGVHPAPPSPLWLVLLRKYTAAPAGHDVGGRSNVAGAVLEGRGTARQRLSTVDHLASHGPYRWPATTNRPSAERHSPSIGRQGHNSILGAPQRAALLTIGCGISRSSTLSHTKFAENARSPGKSRFIAILGVFRLENLPRPWPAG